jgi:hypothetical protein
VTEFNGIKLSRGMNFLHKRYGRDRRCVISSIGPRYITFHRTNEFSWQGTQVPVSDASKIIERIVPSDDDLARAYYDHALYLLRSHFSEEAYIEEMMLDPDDPRRWE